MPAARSRAAQAMKRSKPCTVVGGGEMKRATSSVVSIASSEGASSRRISRSVKDEPVRTGSPDFQSEVVTVVRVSVWVVRWLIMFRRPDNLLARIRVVRRAVAPDDVVVPVGHVHRGPVAQHELIAVPPVTKSL